MDKLYAASEVCTCKEKYKVMDKLYAASEVCTCKD